MKPALFLTMSLEKKFSVRPYDESTDDTHDNIQDIVAKTPRHPIDNHHPVVLETMPYLSPRSRVMVAQENASGRIVGAFSSSINEKRVRSNKKNIYSLNCHVHHAYRDERIAAILYRDSLRAMSLESVKPLLFSLVPLKQHKWPPVQEADIVMDTVQLGLQTQSVWRVDRQLEGCPEATLPVGAVIAIWQEVHRGMIRNRWETMFASYSFIPTNLYDLLDSQFHTATYMASHRLDGRMSEASISVWSQDKVVSMVDSNGQPLRHRQLYACYSAGQYGDALFRSLLAHVHNELEEAGVDYVSTSVHETDPIYDLFSGDGVHTPLVKLVHHSEYMAQVASFSDADTMMLEKLGKEESALWSDPRDSPGIVLNTDALLDPCLSIIHSKL
eukprot:gene14480-17084_t